MNNIIIPYEKELEKKIKAMKQDGKEKLHILSDFDRTLTYAFFNGEKTPSLIAHLRNGNYLSKDYAEKAKVLFNKYHPIELSTEISQEEKKKAMLTWWSTHYKLLIESGLNERTIKQAVKDLIKEKKIRLREGVKDFLEDLNKYEIPLIILSSAGIGNMVTEFLREQNLLFNNINFIGNTLKFDNKGNFKGIQDNKIIHILNKEEAELKNLPVYKQIQGRKNIILLGDSLDDLNMIKGIDYENLITIGFMNYEEDIKKVDKKFDIIILNDGAFEDINKILREIIS